MSRQFKVTRIFRTVAPAISTNHDGTPFEHEDCPIGTVLAIDVEGDVFGWNGSFLPSHSAADWSSQDKKPIPLFRDHWVFLMTAEEWSRDPKLLSPVNAALRAAGAETIWTCQKG